MKLAAWAFGLLISSVLAGAPAASIAAQPDLAERLDTARKEAVVVVYGTTELVAARPLIEDFQALHPDVKVDYRELESSECNRRFLAESASGAAGADVVWSSAMDLQVKLVNDGHALHYASTEIEHLPAWSVWRAEAYGTTFEPVGLAYNEQLLPERQVPRTHAELADLLNSDGARFDDKVMAYDLANAGLGFLVATQDARISHVFWDVARGLGRNGVRLVPNTSTMLDRIATGQTLLAYNVLGSYSQRRAQADPAIGLVYFRDYTLVVSRIAFISRRARHPEAAKLWLDHLLSQRGQTVLAQRSGLFSLRSDVPGNETAAALERQLGASLQPIAIGPSLMAYLDRHKRQDFLQQWKRALARQ